MIHTAEYKPRSAWFWVPSLYFSEGIPYVIVMTMSVVMYKRLGLSNGDIALYTSWLYLPWVIKPLWSPAVDILRTKRFWVVAMQFMIALALALAAFSVGTRNVFRWSLCLFWIMAFASATHDIAADGFYMLGLNAHEQAWWVGWRSTFYRTAMVVGAGLLVVLAGVLESKNGLPAVSITVSTKANAPATANPDPGQINFPPPSGKLHILAQPTVLEIGRGQPPPVELQAILDSVRRWNQSHGFLETKPSRAASARAGEEAASFKTLGGIWRQCISQPLERFLARHFSSIRPALAPAAGNTGIIYLALSQPPAAGRPIVVNLTVQKSGLQLIGLAAGGHGITIPEGGRLIFSGTNWNQPAMAVVQVDAHLSRDVAVRLQAESGNIPVAWSITLLSVAALFLGFSCWHAAMLPRPPGDRAVVAQGWWVSEFFATLGSFFRKPHLGLALAFILFYRFDEAQLGKVISPFLLDSRAAGGLGLATSQVGLAYGTFGILALTGGGLLGGFLAARHGLKKMLPFMVAAMYLTKLVFPLLAWLQPQDFLAICGAVALEQFGYGFGFTAFILFLLYFAKGPHQTAHYAIATGFMALGMMVPGLWSGWLADIVGYRHFFVWVIISTLPGWVLAWQLRIDRQYGKRNTPFGSD